MNEGKPTKEKWWNRPRTQESSDGAGADQARTPVAGQAGHPGADGDFELARPMARQDGDDDGDYALRRPEPPATREDSAGDREQPGGAAQTAAVGGDGAAADSLSAAAQPAAPSEAAPKPLHDPDPYSTPPYGEPGPWAPAPPVQHPAATPAQGVAIPGQPPLPGAPAQAAHPGLPAPAPGAPAPTAQLPTQAPTAPPGTQVPGQGPTPPPGTQLPAQAPTAPPTAQVPAQAPTAPPTAQLPAQASTAQLGTQLPAQAPVPAAQDVAPALPPTAQAPSPASPPTAPAPAAAPAPATAQPHAASAPVAALPHAAAGQAPPPAAAHAPGPWQRYDPWAAHSAPGGAGPLQQNGAAVLSTDQRRKRGRKALVLGAVLLALVSGGIGGAMGTYLERNGGVGTVELPQAGKEAAARDADSVAGIAGRALPSVVTLHVSGSGEQGTGTGFVLDDRGHILTNNHVVKPAGSSGEITVTFNSGETARAEVVGRDSGYDLAVVKVKGVSGLTPLPLGNSDNVQVGDPVVAIGAPFDLAGTVTSGIISAKQRPITAGGEKGDGSDVSYVDALQTDAPINPGNSGGPLLDAKARVIGINSAIRSAGSGSELDSGQSGSIGLGFAIPINQGKRVAEELINTGKATHPVIGITLDMGYTGDGARVGTKGSEGGPPVTAGGPGAKAGIKAGDVITAVDGRRVHSGEELIVKTRAHRPGDRLELTLERGGEERTVSLVLGSSGG
ncbi:trypsin-like peptidase domain-containing protein [Streptomyces sp. bgisy032]|uniref:S1C family serine protease n=1 Tax=Streptomyces sp. bgisy032 TaxID=3413773 RepID=UPI003D7574AF